MNNAVHAANLVATIVLSKLPVLRQFSHMFLTLAWRQRRGVLVPGFRNFVARVEAKDQPCIVVTLKNAGA
jgi:hypothetical protein